MCPFYPGLSLLSQGLQKAETLRAIVSFFPSFLFSFPFLKRRVFPLVALLTTNDDDGSLHSSVSNHGLGAVLDIACPSLRFVLITIFVDSFSSPEDGQRRL